MALQMSITKRPAANALVDPNEDPVALAAANLYPTGNASTNYSAGQETTLPAAMVNAAAIGTTPTVGQPNSPAVPYGSPVSTLGVTPTATPPSLAPATIQGLVSQYGGSPATQNLVNSMLHTESNYGQNQHAYLPNAVGAVGPGQILSSAMGGKYGNFEQYADPSHQDPMNPTDSTIASINMARSIAQKTGNDPLKFAKQYLGTGTDSNGSNANSYAASLVNNMGATLPSASAPLIPSTATMTPPLINGKAVLDSKGLPIAQMGMADHTGQIVNLADAASYNNQAAKSANDLAAANLNSTNVQGTNDANPDSLSSHVGATVTAAGNANDAIYKQVAQAMSPYNLDGTPKSFLQKLHDQLLVAPSTANMQQTNNEIAQASSDSLQRAQKNTTGQQAINANNFPNTTALNQAASGLVNNSNAVDQMNAGDTQRLGVNNNAALGVASDTLGRLGAETAQQNADTNVINAGTQRSLAAIAAQKEKDNANEADPYVDTQPGYIAAAKTMGVILPHNMKVSEYLRQLPKDQQQAMMTLASNGGSLGNSTASSIAASQLPNMPTPLAAAGQGLMQFQAAVLANAKDPANPTQPLLPPSPDALSSPAQQAASAAAYNAKVATVMQTAIAGAAAGDPAYSNLAGNPYHYTPRETLASGVTLPEGITKQDLLGPAYPLFTKLYNSGQSPTQIASFFQNLTSPPASVDANVQKAFGLPNPTGTGTPFVVKAPGVTPFNLTSPVDVQRYVGYLKASDVNNQTLINSQGTVIPSTFMNKLLHNNSGILGTPQDAATYYRAKDQGAGTGGLLTTPHIEGTSGFTN